MIASRLCKAPSRPTRAPRDPGKQPGHRKCPGAQFDTVPRLKRAQRACCLVGTQEWEARMVTDISGREKAHRHPRIGRVGTQGNSSQDHTPLPLAIPQPPMTVKALSAEGQIPGGKGDGLGRNKAAIFQACSENPGWLNYHECSFYYWMK